MEDNLSQLLKLENLYDEYKHFKFHHIGIATTNIEKSFEDYQCLGYKKSDIYIDENIGVKGLFATNENMPALELLENLLNRHSLDIYINHFIKIFHQAYIVDDFKYCCDVLVNKLGCKIISDIYISTYFKGKCCYIRTPDKFILELIEDSSVRY
ncbi:MAG: VOC family protein [bacterium]|nr:VOC family protein [bacterium]